MRYPISILTLSLLVHALAANAPAEETAAPKPSRAASVMILLPAKNSTVGSEATASGTCNPPDLDHIWVFVWPRFSADLAFPQSRRATHLSCVNGQWETPVVFQGPPQHFDVTVHVGTPAASETIERCLVSGARADGYPGKKLPRGLVRKASVQVVKKK